jgi:uncharacterized phage-associated protein
MFTARRVAQMAAFFARKQGGTINVLKLTKLLYLSDRESLSQTGLPISFDDMVSMPDGPVLSRTLNLINGSYDQASSAMWEEWIADRENYDVSIKREFDRQDLDQLSDADLAVLEKVWSQFGKMDKYTLRDWTHDNCPEWVDPRGSSNPIKAFDVLRKLGKSEPEAKEFANSIQSERDLDAVFARL